MEHVDEPAGGAANGRIGDRLRTAREEQQLTLDDVAAHTRVPKRMLELIESGNHAALPAPTYSAGFIKVYAQLVGLDGVELSRQFREELNRTGQDRRRPEPFEPADPARVPSRLLATIALAFAIVIAIGFGIWRGGSLWGDGADDRARLAAGSTVAPVEAAPAIDPVMAPPVPLTTAPASAPAAGGPVTITTNDTVWLRIYERDGRSLFSGEMPAGQRYDVPADAVDPLIRTARPESLQISVGGRPIQPLGRASALVRDVSLKGAALLARDHAGGAVADPALPDPAVPDHALPDPNAMRPLVPTQ
ncbi:MAG: putative Xre family transcriptional regulator [Sphingomonas bacterium]|nr:putative Xre family transcriptional regulator [Sphingomonas bacterium]